MGKGKDSIDKEIISSFNFKFFINFFFSILTNQLVWDISLDSSISIITQREEMSIVASIGTGACYIL